MSMLPLLVISTENRLVRSSLPLPQDPCTGVADRSSAPAAPPAAPLVRPPAEKTATAVQPERECRASARRVPGPAESAPACPGIPACAVVQPPGACHVPAEGLQQLPPLAQGQVPWCCAAQVPHGRPQRARGEAAAGQQDGPAAGQGALDRQDLAVLTRTVDLDPDVVADHHGRGQDIAPAAALGRRAGYRGSALARREPAAGQVIMPGGAMTPAALPDSAPASGLTVFTLAPGGGVNAKLDAAGRANDRAV